MNFFLNAGYASLFYAGYASLFSSITKTAKVIAKRILNLFKQNLFYNFKIKLPLSTAEKKGATEISIWHLKLKTKTQNVNFVALFYANRTKKTTSMKV